MAFAAYAENAIMALIFNATTWANMAVNATASPLATLQLSLHTGDPTAGSQSTNEAAYTGYTREGVARTSGGFTIAGGVATLAAACNFPAGTGGGETVTNFGIGVASSGSTNLIIAGTVSPSITTGAGITPQLTAATTVTLT